MKGTEKQIKWAEEIKAQAIQNCMNYIAANESIGMHAEENELYRIMALAIEAVCDKLDDAAKIIDKRHLFEFRSIERSVQRADRLIRQGKLTVEQFARANGVVDY